MSINVVINGKPEELDQSSTLAELLKLKGVRLDVVTVELNDKIIEKKVYDSTFIKQGDRLEFVYSMGGAALTSFKAQEMTRRYLREEPIPIGSPANEERDVALYLGMSVLFGGLSSYGLLRKVRKEEQDKKSTP